MSDWFMPKNEPVEKPYPSPLEPGVICRVEMARSGEHAPGGATSTADPPGATTEVEV